jgi:hypothetical protein
VLSHVAEHRCGHRQDSRPNSVIPHPPLEASQRSRSSDMYLSTRHFAGGDPEPPTPDQSQCSAIELPRLVARPCLRAGRLCRHGAAANGHESTRLPGRSVTTSRSWRRGAGVAGLAPAARGGWWRARRAGSVSSSWVR